jgi:hypothetical protein
MFLFKISKDVIKIHGVNQEEMFDGDHRSNKNLFLFFWIQLVF